MAAAEIYRPPSELDVAELAVASAGDGLVLETPVIDVDGNLDAVQLSAIVAAQVAVDVAHSQAQSAGDVDVAEAQSDALARVPDRRTADRLALAISDWAARQGPVVIEFLYAANARYGQLPTPEAQADAVESLQARQGLNRPCPLKRGSSNPRRAPNWRTSPSVSETVQSSAILPSSKRLIVMPGSVTVRPRWVPCPIQRETTRSPSVTWSTTSIRRS
jgi:hypothetical protein